MIGTSLGMMVSLALVVGAFFGMLDDLLPPGLAWVALPPLLVVVTLAALTTTRTARRFATLVRISAPVAAAIVLLRGHIWLAAAVALFGLIGWWGYWLSARRIEGRSLGGVWRDVRYSITSVARRGPGGT